VLVVVRCMVCDDVINSWREPNVKGYSEKLTDKPCSKCTDKVPSVEQKLLNAIFGET